MRCAVRDFGPRARVRMTPSIRPYARCHQNHRGSYEQVARVESLQAQNIQTQLETKQDDITRLVQLFGVADFLQSNVKAFCPVTTKD